MTTVTKAKLKKIRADLQDVRKLRGPQSQTVFWSKYGVTQSKGSRLESGENKIDLSLHTLMTLHLAGAITDEDLKAAVTIDQ